MEEIILDVIPIYINEIYPSKDKIWKFKGKITKNRNRVQTLDEMIKQIKHRYCTCNAVIILEQGKVIEVL